MDVPLSQTRAYPTCCLACCLGRPITVLYRGCDRFPRAERKRAPVPTVRRRVSCFSTSVYQSGARLGLVPIALVARSNGCGLVGSSPVEATNERGMTRMSAEGPMRVIVADDDALARRVIKGTLQDAGIIVVAEAADGREAVELGLHYRPDVIVMDVVMPGLDGILATRKILQGNAGQL